MINPKILYVSPFLPKKSGISDYSEILVYGLKEYFDITLLIDDYSLENKKLNKDFSVKRYGKDSIDYSEYDTIIYNIGNNPEYHMYMYELIMKYSGYVILHDYSLFYLTSGYYQQKNKLFSKIYEIEGSQGIHIAKEQIKKGNFNNILECKSIADKLFLNKEVLSRAKGIIVHSDYTKNMIENLGYNNVLKINMINMNNNDNEPNVNNSYLKKKYDIADNDIVVGSFGNIAPTKQNHLICKAIKHYNSVNEEKIYYIMAGAGDYVDEYLDKYIIKTGFIDIDKYNDIMKRTNLVFNLRYPSMGETSISLIHAMGMGKACVITDDAWFKEIPDEYVIKVEYDSDYMDIYNLLHDFILNRAETLNKGKLALKYINDEYNLSKTSRSIFDFINNDNFINTRGE